MIGHLTRKPKQSRRARAKTKPGQKPASSSSASSLVLASLASTLHKYIYISLSLYLSLKSLSLKILSQQLASSGIPLLSVTSLQEPLTPLETCFKLNNPLKNISLPKNSIPTSKELPPFLPDGLLFLLSSYSENMSSPSLPRHALFLPRFLSLTAPGSLSLPKVTKQKLLPL